ncbi:MAG: 30S ribosomal protein THX [Gelidibacter sp.]
MGKGDKKTRREKIHRGTYLRQASKNKKTSIDLGKNQCG